MSGESPRAQSDAKIEAGAALIRQFAAAPKLHRYGDGQWECLFCHEATTVQNHLNDHADGCLWRRAVLFGARAHSTDGD